MKRKSSEVLIMMEMTDSYFIIMVGLFFVVAALYSSVGHAGASGYSAVMALFSVAPALMRPTSLMLNLVVGSIGLYRFQKAGLINFKTVTPFLVTSMPAAYWAAQLNIQKQYFYLALGFMLLLSGIRLILSQLPNSNEIEVRQPSLFLAFLCGGIIGIFSGITGTGGAIFFTPLLLNMKWANPKNAAGLSVVFVMANSIFGLAGILKSSQFFNAQLMAICVCAVIAGAVLGTHYGIFKYSNLKIQRVLGVVMVIAAVKLFLIF